MRPNCWSAHPQCQPMLIQILSKNMAQKSPKHTLFIEEDPLSHFKVLLTAAEQQSALWPDTQTKSVTFLAYQPLCYIHER